MGAVALVAVPVFVSSWAADQVIPLEAKVDPFCKFNTAAFGSLNNAVPSGVSTASSTVTIPSPINTSGPDTGKLRTAGFQLNMDSICNASNRVVVITANGGLKHEAAASVGGGLTTIINYTASVSFPGGPGSSSAVLETNGTPGQEIGNTISGPRAGNTRLTFTLDAQTATVMAAGEYSDTLTVRLEPQ